MGESRCSRLEHTCLEWNDDLCFCILKSPRLMDLGGDISVSEGGSVCTLLIRASAHSVAVLPRMEIVASTTITIP